LPTEWLAFLNFVFVMEKKYDHPLLNDLVEICIKKRLAEKQSHEEFGKDAGVDKSYMQRFEKFKLNPGLINADNLARNAGKKLVLVDINHSV